MRTNLIAAAVLAVLSLCLGFSSDLAAQSDASGSVASSVGIVLPDPPEPRPNPQYMPDFHGVINLDVRNSRADWTPFTPSLSDFPCVEVMRR
jgi:hypothetical protein